MVRLSTEDLTKAEAAAREMVGHSNILMLIGVLLVIAVSLISGLGTGLGITKSLGLVKIALERLAQGDFDQKIEIQFRMKLEKLPRHSISHCMVSPTRSAIRSALQKAEHGNLKVSVNLEGSDPITAIGKSVNTLLASFRESLGSVSGILHYQKPQRISSAKATPCRSHLKKHRLNRKA